MSLVLSALLFLVFTAESMSQGTEGKRFVFAFGANHGIEPGTLEVFIATNKKHSVSFNFTFAGKQQTGSVNPGDVFSYYVDTSQRMSAHHVTIEQKAQIIEASDDIVVSAINNQTVSADSFTVLPLEALGTEYYIAAWQGEGYVYSGSMAVVVAVEDNTTFTMELAGETLFDDVTLNKYDVFQYLGLNAKTTNATAELKWDITGAHFTSNKPIAVMSGNRRCIVEARPGTSGTSDHIVEMIPPVTTLGKEFIVSSFVEREGDILRIIASEASTILTITAGSLVSKVRLIEAGMFYQLEVNRNDSLWILSDKPILVSQYAKSGKIGGDRKPDAMMILLVPTEQYSNAYTFTSLQSGASSEYRSYVNLIIPANHQDELIVDGKPVNRTFSDLKLIPGDTFNENLWVQDSWVTVGSSGYSSRTLAVTGGTHTIISKDSGTNFSAAAYGQSAKLSYGSFAGSRLYPINRDLPTTTQLTTKVTQMTTDISNTTRNHQETTKAGNGARFSPDEGVGDSDSITRLEDELKNYKTATLVLTLLLAVVGAVLLCFGLWLLILAKHKRGNRKCGVAEDSKNANNHTDSKQPGDYMNMTKRWGRRSGLTLLPPIGP